jgi:hypothetical protein
MPKALPPASDSEAELSPSDVELARDSWRKVAPPGYKNLLDAELTDEEQKELTTEDPS